MKKNNEIYSIKEVAEKTGFEPHVIRYYEKEFQLKIPRTESNRRYFTYREIEDLQYIKKMQDKGLTNPQIRQVLKSPKVIIEPKVKNEVAVANTNKPVVETTQIDQQQWLREAVEYIRMEVTESLKGIDNKQEIEKLTEKIDELRNQLNNQEKDVLVVENSKLKLKLKEKSYEVAELKDRLKRLENQNKSFFSRLFTSKKEKQKQRVQSLRT